MNRGNGIRGYGSTQLNTREREGARRVRVRDQKGIEWRKK
jgi:hypothetical protein